MHTDRLKQLIIYFKYFIVSWYGICLIVFVFFIHMTFFDSNNILKKWKLKYNNNMLRNECVIYKNKIEEDKKKINELSENIEVLEKYARENFLLKKANEDIFIVE